MTCIPIPFGSTIQRHFDKSDGANVKSICGDLLLQRLGQPTDQPLNRALYACIRGAILDGSLAPATRLPPQRDLAAELGLSRNTVMFAYEQLLAEGYLRARTGSGTFVADTAPERYLNATAADSAPATAPAMPGLSPRGCGAGRSPNGSATATAAACRPCARPWRPTCAWRAPCAATRIRC